MRRNDPTRLGTAVSTNSSDTDRVIPMLPRLMTTIVQSTQMLKPMCSAMIEKTRFLVAIRFPVVSQKIGSSGSQCSIQRPRRDVGGWGGAGARTVSVVLNVASGGVAWALDRDIDPRPAT